MKVKFDEYSICEEMKVANSFFSRLIGLMFKKEMKGYDGLLIKRCNSIHTFFMMFNIDAIFMNKDNEVIRIYKSIKPWRMTRIVWKATQVLELRPGTTPENLKKGDVLTICTS
ncbi:MAG: hypothetical protein BM556_17285 [Bacteriovorax sp. MedPE-SWde]|nr:MAG: hypothetical protein BM556_17285 [Bacteriovorax sp. MedPE-SWde]